MLARFTGRVLGALGFLRLLRWAAAEARSSLALRLGEAPFAFQIAHMPLKQMDEILLQALSIEGSGGFELVGQLGWDVSNIQHLVLGGRHGPR